MRPEPTDYAAAHAKYVDLVPEQNVCDAIEAQSAETQRVLSRLDEERAKYRYAPDKWSIKEVIGHITDAERILGYRALAIARGETQSLPGFDENTYVENAKFDAWPLGQLAETFALVRRSHIVLFRNLPEEAWTRRGLANNNPVSVRGLVYTILGHERHHLGVLRDRYGL